MAKNMQIKEIGNGMVDVDIDGIVYKNVRMRQPFPDDKDMHDIFLRLTDKTEDGRWELVIEKLEEGADNDSRRTDKETE